MIILMDNKLYEANVIDIEPCDPMPGDETRCSPDGAYELRIYIGGVIYKTRKYPNKFEAQKVLDEIIERLTAFPNIPVRI